MEKYKRKDNKPVVMFKTKDPITLDKTKEWGEGNIQKHEDGCWVQLKLDDNDVIISHLVADDNDLPVGWKRYEGVIGLFSHFVKDDVWAYQTEEKNLTITTLDGKMNYPNETEDGWVLFNNVDNTPNKDDSWFMKDEEFKKLYIVE